MLKHKTDVNPFLSYNATFVLILGPRIYRKCKVWSCHPFSHIIYSNELLTNADYR